MQTQVDAITFLPQPFGVTDFFVGASTPGARLITVPGTCECTCGTCECTCGCPSGGEGGSLRGAAG